MTETATIVEPPRAPPRSLWRDAFDRLLKNKLAVASLAWVALISVVSGLASWIVPFNPSAQELWYGKTPPFTRHAKLAARMTFGVGEPPPEPFPAASSSIELDVEQARHRDLRAPLRDDGAVERIELGPDLDAEDPHEDTPLRFTLGEHERIVWTEGKEPRSVTSVVLEVGKPLPPELGRQALAQRTFVGEWRKGEKTITLVANVAGGKVKDVAVDKKAERNVTIEAEDVPAARVDGRPFTHVHLLGSDDGGRDILSRTIFGGQISLLVGLVATLVSLVIGVAYGAISGYAGGKVDEVMMRFVDILYAIPFMFVVIILLVTIGQSLLLLFAAIGAVEWLTMARIVRGQVLSLKEKEYVEAARTSGTGPLGIVFGHLVPNSLGPVIVYTTLTIPEVILTEAFLSFLGLGVKYEDGSTIESWGSLTEAGMKLAQGGFPWLLFSAATALSLTLFSLNFLGDGLRDALDPRGRGR